MKPLWPKLLALSCCVLAAGGCFQGRAYYFFRDDDLEHYRELAATAAPPDEPAAGPAALAAPPITVDTFNEKLLRPVSLDEAVNLCLANSRILRRLGPVPLAARAPGIIVPAYDEALLRTPAAATGSVFDVGIQETNPGATGPPGVAAALSAFDLQFSSQMFWERVERPMNLANNVFNNELFARDFHQDLGTFRAELAKTSRWGGRAFARQNTDYNLNNNPQRETPDEFAANVEFGFAQPLLRGSGTVVTDIVGRDPQGGLYGPGVYQGVAIARLNQEISLADFECDVNNLVLNLENAYWELSFAYQAFAAARHGRDAALSYLRTVEARGKYPAEVIEGARGDYLRFVAEVNSSLSDLLQSERALRYQLGLPPTDGQVLRPVDQPTEARVSFDWATIHTEALAGACELRRQRDVVRQKELSLIASRNYLLPQLDAVALYRWLGAGDDLIDPRGRGVFPFAGSNAFSTLANGNYQEWQMGFQFHMPLGFRRELASVRNAQLVVAKERALLRDQELLVTHLLSDAVRELEDGFRVLQARLGVWQAAQRRYDALRARIDAGLQVSFLDYREAIRTLANAEAEYFRARINYHKQVPRVHHRKGTLLAFRGIHLAEAPLGCEPGGLVGSVPIGTETMDYSLPPSKPGAELPPPQ